MKLRAIMGLAIVLLSTNVFSQPFNNFASFDGETYLTSNTSGSYKELTIEAEFRACDDPTNSYIRVIEGSNFSIVVGTKFSYIRLDRLTISIENQRFDLNLVDGKWHHFAFCFYTSNGHEYDWHLAVDGKTVVRVENERRTFIPSLSRFHVGSNATRETQGVFQIDELRISNKIRYPYSEYADSNNFAPPTKAHWNDEYTIALFSFDDINEEGVPPLQSHSRNTARTIDTRVEGALVLRNSHMGIGNKTQLSSTICYGDSLFVTAEGGNKYKWSTKTNAYLSSTTYNSCWFRPHTSGYVYVQVRDTASCEVTTDSFWVSVGTKEFNLAPEKDTICAGGQTNFSQTQPSGVQSFYWSPQDGVSNINDWNPVFSPKETTTYYLQAKGSSCTDVIPFTVMVGTKSELERYSAYHRCLRDTVRFRLKKGTNAQWKVNAKYIALGNDSVKFSIRKPTKVQVKHTNRFGCTINDSSIATMVSYYYNVNTTDSVVCEGGSTRLRGSNSSSSNFNWYTKKDGTISNKCCPTVYPKTPTWYFFETTGSGCNYIDSVFVDVIKQSDLKIQLKDVVTKCYEDTAFVTFSSSHPITWSNNSRNEIRNDTMFFYGNYSTSYTAKISVPNCELSKTVDLEILPWQNKRTSFTTSPYYFCKGDTVTLYLKKGDSFLWQQTPNLISNINRDTLQFIAKNPFEVSLLNIDDNGCRRTLRKQLYYRTSYGLDYNPPAAVCLGDSVEIDFSESDSYINKFEWKPANSLVKHFGKYYVKPASVGNLLAIYPVDIGGKTCYDSIEVPLKVSTGAKVELIGDTIVTEGSDVQLNQGIPASQGLAPYVYKWSYLSVYEDDRFGIDYFSDSYDQRINVSQPTSVQLQVTDAANCVSTDTVHLSTKKSCGANISYGKALSPVFYRNNKTDLTYKTNSFGFYGTNNLVFLNSGGILIRRGDNILVKVAGTNDFRQFYPFPKMTALCQSPDGQVYAATKTAVYKADDDLNFDLIGGHETQTGSTNGKLSSALFSNIYSLRCDKAGELYVQDGNVIRKITNENWVTKLYTQHSGAELSQFDIDSKGNAYTISIENYGFNFHVTDTNGVSKKLFGYTGWKHEIKDGIAGDARHRTVQDLTVINDSLLWFFDLGKIRIRQLNLNTQAFTTVFDMSNRTGLMDYYDPAKLYTDGNQMGSLHRGVNGQIYLAAYEHIYHIKWQPVICRGEKLELTVSNAPSGSQYEWNTSETGQTINVSPFKTASYYVDVANTSGCGSRLHADVYVDHADIGDLISLCHKDTLVVGQRHTGGSYQWYPKELNDGQNYRPTFTLRDSSIRHLVLKRRTSFCGETVDSAFIQFVKPQSKLLTKNITACEGDSITLRATGGTNYHWLGTGVEHKGSDSTVTMLANKAQYIVFEGYNDNCVVRDTASISFIKSKPLSIDFDRSKLFCKDDTVSISTNHHKIQWEPAKLFGNSTARRTYFNLSGASLVQISSADGCWVPAQASITPDTARLRFTPQQDSLDFCEGDSLVLNALPEFTQVKWNDQVKGPSRTIKTSGTYSASALSPSGCPTTSKPIYTLQNTAPDTTILLRNDSLVAAKGVLYTWYRDNKKIGATTRSIKPDVTGTYKVEVENKFGCKSVNSRKVLISSIRNIPSAYALSLYPNPARDHFIIQGKLSAYKGLKVYNGTGQLLASIIPLSGSESQYFTCTEWKKGIYLLKAETHEGLMFTKKLILE